MPDEDLDEVVACERLLLEPNVRARPDAVLARLHPDFVEFGASGRTWDGPAVVDALAVEGDGCRRFRKRPAPRGPRFHTGATGGRRRARDLHRRRRRSDIAAQLGLGAGPESWLAVAVSPGHASSNGRLTGWPKLDSAAASQARSGHTDGCRQQVGYNVRLVSDPANAAGIPEQAPPSTAESLAAGHEVVVEDGGPFTVARCTCGWYTPARRSRPLARGEAADHLRLHGLLP